MVILFLMPVKTTGFFVGRSEEIRRCLPFDCACWQKEFWYCTDSKLKNRWRRKRRFDPLGSMNIEFSSDKSTHLKNTFKPQRICPNSSPSYKNGPGKRRSDEKNYGQADQAHKILPSVFYCRVGRLTGSAYKDNSRVAKARSEAY